LIGALMAFIFSAKIKRCLLFPVIFIPLLSSFTYSLFLVCLFKVRFFLSPSSFFFYMQKSFWLSSVVLAW
jgi:hypothetical protein